MSRMSVPKSHCPHISTIGNITKYDIISRQNSCCDICKAEGPILWICLHQDCLYVGCNDSTFDNHCLKHFEKNIEHCLFLQLTFLHVFCLLCEKEVYLENNDPPVPGLIEPPAMVGVAVEETAEPDTNFKPRGLTGLQNLGNTCYMNSALQALSNCRPLTQFFLHCEPYIPSDKKPGLARSYMRLVQEMWNEKRPSYVVPTGIAYGMKVVYPVFRGYAQQDAQEFLRCFMDQLHEELKYPVFEMPGSSPSSSDIHEEFSDNRRNSGIPVSEDSSHSEDDYETCDSALSEKSSCSDEAADSPKPLRKISPDEKVHALVHPSIRRKKRSSLSVHKLVVASSSDKDISSKKQIIGDLLTPSDISIKKGDENNAKGDSVSSPEIGISDIDIKNAEIRDMDIETMSVQSGLTTRWIHTSALNSLITRRREPVGYRSIISDVFDGKILSSVQCLTCDSISTTKETFQDLSLPIPAKDHVQLIHASQGSLPKNGIPKNSNLKNSNGTCTDVYNRQGWFSSLFGWIFNWFWGPCITLQDCLSAFFSADELKGDNMYSCDRCKKLRNGVKFSKVIQLPEVLCIHLKRFRHEVMFSSKISNYVSFPLEGLDMSPFLHKGYPQGVTTYDLISVICHHGTAGSGHYTAYCFNSTNMQWYEFDDQYVTAVDDEVVKHCEAYVLFYQKSNEGMLKKRECACNLIDCAQVEKDLLAFNVSLQWIIKFNEFAEPGPITNSDFLCVHGGVPLDKVSRVRDLCLSVPQAVWEYFHESFGGGPPSTHLYICPICKDELVMLHSKRKTELDEFTMMNCDFHSKERSPVIYALSMKWFKTWENFICKDDDPPGPIDNSSICCMKNNQAVLKYGSHYCAISKEMYVYLKGIYGGGPDVAVQANANVIPSPSSTPRSSASGHSRTSSNTVTDTQIVSVHAGCRQNLATPSQPSPSDKDKSPAATEGKPTLTGKVTGKVDDSIGN